MRVLGVDPGLAGAAAIIETVDGVDGTAPKLVDAIDIPILGIAAKTRVDAIGLRNWIESLHPDFAGVERAGSMPRQGVASAFKFGRSAGAIETVVACLNIPMLLVEPSKWKRALHLNSDKEAARQLAIGLFPHAQLNLKRHHQRAEAMLIAFYVLSGERLVAAAIKAAGGVRLLARELGIRPEVIQQWKCVPAERLEAIAKITGLPQHVLRPDLFPDVAEPQFRCTEEEMDEIWKWGHAWQLWLPLPYPPGFLPACCCARRPRLTLAADRGVT